MQTDDAFWFMKVIIRDRAYSSAVRRDRWGGALETIRWVVRDGEAYRITTEGRRAMERHYKLPFGQISKWVRSGQDERPW